jgi:hypothetical protein
VVRLINQLCENALMNAFCDDEMQVAAKHVEVAARDLEIAPLPDASAAPAESQDANAAAALSSLQQRGTHE